MKSWKITYTENKGTTYNIITTEAETYTKAYINGVLKIPFNAEITELKEIK